MTDTTVLGSSTGTSGADSASSVEQAKDAAKTVAGSTATEARAVVDEAKGAARDLVGDARSQLRTQAGDQAQRLAQTLRSFGDQLSSMGQGQQAQGTAAEMARQAGDRTRHMAQRIEQGGLDGVVADAKRFARNRPGAFLLGAVGAGFVVGRVLKNADTHALASAAKPNGDEASTTPEVSSFGTPPSFASPSSFATTGPSAPMGDLPMGPTNRVTGP